MLFKRIFLSLALTLIVTNSYAYVVCFDPFNAAKNAITARNSVQSLVNQAKELEYQIKNFKNLTGNYQNTTARLLEDLKEINQTGNAINYTSSDIEKLFRKNFPGFNEDNGYPANQINRSNAVKETLLDSMKSLTLQGKALSQEKFDVDDLARLSSKSGGSLEAQQVMHRIQLEQITQLQKLRQLLLTQASSEQAYYAYQLQKDQTMQSIETKWIDNSQLPFRKYDGRQGFGPDDFPVISDGAR